jgi:hypothetical protein
MKMIGVIVGLCAPLAALSLLTGCGESPFTSLAGDGSTSGQRGAPPSCDDGALASSFADSCIKGLADIFTCWNPSGNCHVSGFEVTFDNGSGLESSIDGSLRFTGPSGELCGTAQADYAGGANEVTFTTPEGDNYLYMIDQETADVTVRCPSGEVVTVDVSEAEALADCSGSDAFTACSAPTYDDVPFDDDDLPDIGADCQSDADCMDFAGIDLMCCGLGGGDAICLTQEACGLTF